MAFFGHGSEETSSSGVYYSQPSEAHVAAHTSAASISHARSQEQSAVVEFDIIGDQTSWKSQIACVQYRRQMADQSRATEDESSSCAFYSQRSEGPAAGSASTDEDTFWSGKSDTRRKK